MQLKMKLDVSLKELIANLANEEQKVAQLNNAGLCRPIPIQYNTHSQNQYNSNTNTISNKIYLYTKLG